MPKPTHYSKYGVLCILSVDDDSVNLMVIEQLLAPQGWKVISAADGADAMAVLEGDSFWPDLVFLDYQMNVGDSGDEICRKMRQLFGSVPIPIVMCTAMAASSALADCKAAGATDFLLKPYERTKMLEKVEQYCGDKVNSRAPPAPLAVQAAQSSPTVSQTAPQSVRQPVNDAVSQLTPSEQVKIFFLNIDLEYCGQKLADAGYTMDQLRAMDDVSLRKAGIVVKAQRDKILAAMHG